MLAIFFLIFSYSIYYFIENKSTGRPNKNKNKNQQNFSTNSSNFNLFVVVTAILINLFVYYYIYQILSNKLKKNIEDIKNDMKEMEESFSYRSITDI